MVYGSNVEMGLQEFLLWTDAGRGRCDERLGFFMSFYRKTFYGMPSSSLSEPCELALVDKKGLLLFPVKSLLPRLGLCLPMGIGGTS